ncbi:MAG TPA: acyl-CoA dehydrogenase family protein [Longimicrobiales bacterium]|nr:acyl-CoA dehydrogenase family protein [Longimicrobiales bacterium]
MPFVQPSPRLGNQYDDDAVLRSYLRRALPPDVLREIEPALREMGRLAGGPLHDLQRADRLSEPVLVQTDAWGNRVDRVELTRVWREAERVAAEAGVVATAYERRHGRHSRVHGFALAYLFTPSTDFYGCPLAMADGAARALLAAGADELVARALPRLTSRDPARVWVSGQWMTELPGGSDVSRTETVARRGDDGVWRLHGRKWFVSAVTAPMALALARPEGNPPGSRGLALFYVEPRDEDGRLQGVRVERLKDKLGTRKLPTAELTLDGVPAVPVAGLTDGVRAVAPMLNVTRTWNAITAAALMRRGVALATDHAARREAFGRPLRDLPLHADTLAGVEAELEAALHLAFRLAEGLGVVESGDGDVAGETALLRVLTPIVKLTTARQAVAVASEAVEALGGVGYIEDSGMPALLRDAQVLSIWEGTTNVLALDALRAVAAVDGVRVLEGELRRRAASLADPGLAALGDVARSTVEEAGRWLEEASARESDAAEAGARRFALQLGRATALALLAHHAQWALDQGDARPAAAARRFAANGVRATG